MLLRGAAFCAGVGGVVLSTRRRFMVLPCPASERQCFDGAGLGEGSPNVAAGVFTGVGGGAGGGAGAGAGAGAGQVVTLEPGEVGVKNFCCQARCSPNSRSHCIFWVLVAPINPSASQRRSFVLRNLLEDRTMEERMMEDSRGRNRTTHSETGQWRRG
jgi:hypothetical protein